jgi:hypothetical protein
MPTDGMLLLLGLVVGMCERRLVPPWPCPSGRRCLDQPLRPWPLVGVHFVATEVVATAEVRASVTVATEARAAVRVEAKVPATEVMRVVEEARAAASRGNASMAAAVGVTCRIFLVCPDRDTYRDHVNTGLKALTEHGVRVVSRYM